MQALHTLPFIAFFSLLLGIFVLSKSAKHKQNITFFVLCFGLFMWGIGVYSTKFSQVFYWPDKFILVGGMLVVLGLYLFSFVFPSDLNIHFAWAKSRKQGIYLTLIPAVIMLLLVPFNIFIKGHNNLGNPVFTQVYPLLVLTQLGYLLFAVNNYITQFKDSIGYKRQQLLYFFSGLGLFLISSAIFDLILPQLGIFNLDFLGPLSCLIFLGFSTAAIISHSLMDVRLLVGNFLLYLSSGVILTLLMVFFKAEVMHVLKQGRGSVILVMFYGLLAYFLLLWILTQISNRFFLEKYRLSAEGFKKLNLALHNQLEAREVLILTNTYLQQALNLRWAYFFDVHTKKATITGDNAIAFPLSEQQVFDKDLNELAVSLKEPKFFHTAKFEAFRKKNIQPIGILPIWDHGIFCGYFLLGPQISAEGLSALQIRKTESTWSHVQTAYSRALLYRALEQKVVQQVKEITRTNYKLQEEIERRIEFLRAASHQLKTPITAMNSSLQLLNNSIKDEESKELIEIAYNKSKNLGGIVDGMLTLAKVEKAKPEEFSAKVSLFEIFKDIQRSVISRVETLGVSISFSNAEKVFVYGNETYLQQAILNLVENAIEHGGKKRGKVDVSYVLEPNFVIVKVSDNGPGIPEHQRNDIFLKHIRSVDARGNGLGLYIVKAIVDAHFKAHIWFESSHKGTDFYLRLRRFDILKA